MSDKLFGRNAVLEAIKSGNRTINKILISKTAHGSAIGEIIKLAKQKGIVINSVIYRLPERLRAPAICSDVNEKSLILKSVY